MPPRDANADALATSQDQDQAAWRRAGRLAFAGLLFLCSATSALFAVILAFGTLLAMGEGQYAGDPTGLAFALIWDLATLVCAIATWRAAMRPADA